jgi:hypothetical protein
MYQQYGDEPSLFDQALSLGKDVVTGVASVALEQFFEPVEITNPPELKGAKLSKAFKIRKDGNDYFVEIDAQVEGIPTAITALAGQLTGRKLDDPKKAQEIDVQIGTIKYEPPPSSLVLYIALGVVALGVVAFFLFGRGSAKDD